MHCFYAVNSKFNEEIISSYGFVYVKICFFVNLDKLNNIFGKPEMCARDKNTTEHRICIKFSKKIKSLYNHMGNKT